MSRARKTIWATFTLVAFSLVIGFFVMRHPSQIGAGYLAKQMCSCMYVARRTFNDCRSDQRTDLLLVTAEHLPDLQGIRARAFPYPPARALYYEGFGCTLE